MLALELVLQLVAEACRLGLHFVDFVDQGAVVRRGQHVVAGLIDAALTLAELRSVVEG